MMIKTIAKQLQALGNPTRLEVFRQLISSGSDGVAVGDIQKVLDIPGSTLTHHLQKLMAANLVGQERKGAVLICRANFDAMGAMFNFLNSECCADETGSSVPEKDG
jgi:ArsR family transcriptional regulator